MICPPAVSSPHNQAMFFSFSLFSSSFYVFLSVCAIMFDFYVDLKKLLALQPGIVLPPQPPPPAGTTSAPIIPTNGKSYTFFCKSMVEKQTWIAELSSMVRPNKHAGSFVKRGSPHQTAANRLSGPTPSSILSVCSSVHLLSAFLPCSCYYYSYYPLPAIT